MYRPARIHTQPGERTEQVDRAEDHEGRVPAWAIETLAATSALSIPPMAPAEFIQPPSVPVKPPPMSVGSDHIEGTPRSWNAKAITMSAITTDY